MKSKGLFYKPTLYEMMPSVLHAFISWRYLVVLLAIAGLVRCTFAYTKYNKEFIRKTIFCLFVLITPLIISFIRGDRPWERFFLNPIPIFCLFLSLCLYFLFVNITEKPKFLYIAVILFLYANLTFAFGVHHISKKLKCDIKLGTKSVTLLYNYWQAHYAPLELMSFYKQNYYQPDITILMYHIDKAATPNYINKFQIPILDPKKLDIYFKYFNDLYIISAYPIRLKEELSYRFPGCEIKQLNDQLQFHNIFCLSNNKTPGNRKMKNMQLAKAEIIP